MIATASSVDLTRWAVWSRNISWGCIWVGQHLKSTDLVKWTVLPISGTYSQSVGDLTKGWELQRENCLTAVSLEQSSRPTSVLFAVKDTRLQTQKYTSKVHGPKAYRLGMELYYRVSILNSGLQIMWLLSLHKTKCQFLTLTHPHIHSNSFIHSSITPPLSEQP